MGVADVCCVVCTAPLRSTVVPLKTATRGTFLREKKTADIF